MKVSKSAVIWITALVFLTSCSTLRIGYEFIDWYLVREIDTFFDLTSEQKRRVIGDGFR